PCCASPVPETGAPGESMALQVADLRRAPDVKRRIMRPAQPGKRFAGVVVRGTRARETVAVPPKEAPPVVMMPPPGRMQPRGKGTHGQITRSVLTCDASTACYQRESQRADRHLVFHPVLAPISIRRSSPAGPGHGIGRGAGTGAGAGAA